MQRIIANLKTASRGIFRPKYTTILHQVRIHFDLNLSEYVVIDSINKFSRRGDHPWCTASKEQIAKFLGIGERTVWRAIDKGTTQNLIEKNDRGDLRATDKWINEVELYQSKRSPKTQEPKEV